MSSMTPPTSSAGNAESQEPFKGPFGAEQYLTRSGTLRWRVYDDDANTVADGLYERGARWLCDRLNATLPPSAPQPVDARWVLVPREPTDAMVTANFQAHAKSPNVFASVSEMWSAMLAASEAPIDAELDELCRMMWAQGHVYWNPEFDSEMPEWQTTRTRNEDRARMKAFLKALQGDQ